MTNLYCNLCGAQVEGATKSDISQKGLICKDHDTNEVKEFVEEADKE